MDDDGDKGFCAFFPVDIRVLFLAENSSRMLITRDSHRQHDSISSSVSRPIDNVTFCVRVGGRAAAQT
jgi:hypothetical protein